MQHFSILLNTKTKLPNATFVCSLFLAWVGSLAMALTNFCGLASGALIKRFGCRVTTLLGGFLCALSLGLSSLAKNILILFLTYSALYGLGSSCVLSASLNIISKYFKKRRSMATGIAVCGQGGGILILGPLLQTMIDTFGWDHLSNNGRRGSIPVSVWTQLQS